MAEYFETAWNGRAPLAQAPCLSLKTRLSNMTVTATLHKTCMLTVTWYKYTLQKQKTRIWSYIKTLELTPLKPGRFRASHELRQNAREGRADHTDQIGQTHALKHRSKTVSLLCCKRKPLAVSAHVNLSYKCRLGFGQLHDIGWPNTQNNRKTKLKTLPNNAFE